MTWKETTDGIWDARSTVGNGDRFIRELCELCRGRLRIASVQGDTLTALKCELRKWDMHRREWKD